MKNAVNFEALRKKRQRARRLRQLLVLLLLTLLVLLGVYLSDLLLRADMSAGIGDALSSFGGQGYPVPLPGGVIRDMDAMGRNLALRNDTTLYIYSPKGKQLLSVQQLTEKSVSVAAKKRVLTYDYGGKKLAVHSAGKTLMTHQFEDMVLGADLGEGGEYAVITSPSHYISKVSAYNSSFQPVLHWYSPDQFVLSVTVAPKGDMMSVACVDGDGGVMKSELHLLRFDTEKETALIPLKGELAVWQDFTAENRLNVLTDKALRSYDELGRLVGEYLLPDGPVTAFQSDGERLALICGGSEPRRLLLLDSSAKLLGEAEVPGSVTSLTIGGRSVYAATGSAVTRYDLSLKPVETMDTGPVQRIQYVEGRVYLCTKDEIRILGEE